MKLRQISALLLAAPAAVAAPVSKLAAEWHVPSVENAGHFALVDAASGAVRLAAMRADGSLDASAPIPTGIAGPSDVAGGMDGAEGELLALTAPEANRVMLVEMEAKHPVARVLPALEGVGPSAVGEYRGGGASGLLVGTIFNGGSAGGVAEIVHELDGSGALLAGGKAAVAFRRGQPLVDPADDSHTAVFYTAPAAGGADTRTGVLLRDGEDVKTVEKSTYPGTWEFVTGVMDVKGGAGRDLALGFVAGSDEALIVEIHAPLASAAFTEVALTFPFPVAGVLPVPGPDAGPYPDGFIAVAADGSQAEWLRIHADGNAFIATGESFVPEKGLFLTAALPLPGRGVVALSAPSPGAPSTAYHTHIWDGGWKEGTSGLLPALADSGAEAASLLYFDADPADDDSARLLAVANVPDWTRRLAFPDPVPAKVGREAFVSPADGLVDAGEHPVSAPAGTHHVLTNQVDAAVSISALGGTSGLFAPELRIAPPSGTYDAAFQIAAMFDERRHSLYWRDEHGGSWRPWHGPLPVAYNRDVQFVLRSHASGALGPVVRRSYQIDSLDSDSDGDGVPDYVELHLGLDPFGGADHDGDGYSDLDEILQGRDPADADDSPATSLGLGSAGGFRLAAIALNHAAQEMADGGELLAHALDGSLLDRGTVAGIAPPLPDGGNRGALLGSDHPLPFDQALLLATPLYFDAASGGRSGRELVGLVPAEPPPALDVVFTPAGDDVAADAAGWIAAATSAAAARVHPAERTVFGPADTAVAVLVEELVHAALDAPPALESFTLFPFRDGAASRTALSAAGLSQLRLSGFDFRAALAVATAARAGMQPAADAIYARHAAVSADTPGMPMPLDALRALLRGDAPPAAYADAVAAGDLTAAQAAYATAMGNAAASFRQAAIWTVEVPGSPAQTGVYLRQPGGVPVVLLDRNGARFRLEQGLGLRPGTRFSVSGFTDTPAVGGMESMEISAATLTFAPASSDNDADGNLLDDEWERYFFGATGQDPFATPHGGGFTLLQHFLDGIDPRGGGSSPGTAVNLSPQAPVIAPAADGEFTIDFHFPSAYQDRFAFVLESSGTLDPGSFAEVPGATVVPVSGDLLRATVPAAAAVDERSFYRVRIRLR